MPIVDDGSIPNTAILLRVLRVGWTCVVEGRKRPKSFVFIDGQTGEVSCFVDGDGIMDAVRQVFPENEIARTTAAAVRGANFAIERRPGQCEGFTGDPNSHVVIGPPDAIGGKELSRRARRIAEHPDTTIVEVPEDQE